MIRPLGFSFFPFLLVLCIEGVLPWIVERVGLISLYPIELALQKPERQDPLVDCIYGVLVFIYGDGRWPDST